MIIPAIGPSKAGKAVTTKALVDSGTPSLSFPVERVDLDEELGPPCRCDAKAALGRVKELVAEDRTNKCVLVDVGAGQLVSPEFACYLFGFPAYPRSVVVIWCDEPTFRLRHGENASNEVGRYYDPANKITSFWKNACSVGRLVDTSGTFDQAQWAQQLSRIVREIMIGQGARAV